MYTRRSLFDADVISVEEFIAFGLMQYEINPLSSPLFPIFCKDFIQSISSIAFQSDLSSYLYMDFPSGSTLCGNPSDSLAHLGTSIRDFYGRSEANPVHNDSRHPLKSDIANFAIESSGLSFREGLSANQKLNLVTVNSLQKIDILNLIINQRLSHIN